MSKSKHQTVEQLKAKLQEYYDNGWAVDFVDLLVKNQYREGFLTSHDVKKVTSDFLTRVVQGEQEHHLSFVVGNVRRNSTVWSQMGAEFMASAVGEMIRIERSDLKDVCKNLQARMSNRAAFQNAAAPIVAEVLDQKVEENIRDVKEAEARNRFTMADRMDFMLMQLMPYPALLEKSGSAMARHIEFRLERGLSEDGLAAMDPEDVQVTMKAGKALSEGFAQQLGFKSALSGLSDEELEDTLTEEPTILDVVKSQPALVETVVKHCKTAPDSFPRTLKVLGVRAPAPTN